MDTLKSRKIRVYSNHTKKSKYYGVMKVFFLLMHLLCGLDFGFLEIKSFKLKLFLKFISILQSIAISCFCLLSINNFLNNPQDYKRPTLFLAYYCVNVIILALMHANKSFRKLFQDLEDFDVKLCVENASYNLERKIFFVALIDFLFRIAVSITICLTDHSGCLQPIISGALYFWIAITMDSVHIACTFVFYALNLRFKKITEILKKTDYNFMTLQLSYKSIVELAEMYKEAFDPLFLVTLMFNVPDVMSTIYYMVEKLRHGNMTTIAEGFLNDYIPVAVGLWITVTPAICAGMLTSEAHRILVVLHQKIMETRDKNEINRIEQFISYVEERECRFRVFKVIPLDADLTGMVLNFWITYLIVIIQFEDS